MRLKRHNGRAMDAAAVAEQAHEALAYSEERCVARLQRICARRRTAAWAPSAPL
jgi:hypothetical protein